MRIVITLVVLAVLGGGGWYGYTHLLTKETPPVYQTAAIEHGTVIKTVAATGTVEPLVTVLVGSQVSGTIVEWYADFNDDVSEGFVLARIDQERFTATLEQRKAAVAVARANVEEAQARLDLAALDRDRIEAVYKRSGGSSQYELDQARAEERAAQANLHGAEAQLQAAQADERSAAIELDKTIIRSPINGIVISRDVDAGQTVAASLQAPTLFTIANDLTKMRVNAAVSEADIGVVKEGMPAEFRVDAFPEQRFRGRVSEVRFAQSVTEGVVTYTALIDVDNEGLLLRPGMTATVQFELERVDDTLMAPNMALRFEPNAAPERIDWRNPGTGAVAQPRVFKLVDGQLLEVPVEIGITDGRFTAIRSDALQAGDEVVTGQTTTAMPFARRPARG